MHDAFDWWANIVIPSIVGFLTLVLTGTSLWVAWQALKLSRRSDEQRLREVEDAKRRDRVAVAPLFKQVFLDALHLAWLRGEEFRNPNDDEAARAQELDQRLAVLGDPHGVQLWEWWIVRVHDHHGDRPIEQLAMSLAGEGLISRWIEDPPSVDAELVRYARWDPDRLVFGPLPRD